MGRHATKKVPKPARLTTATKTDAAERTDGWKNFATGLGVRGYDKTLGSSFLLELLTQVDAEAIWRGDYMAAKAVEKIPNEALREGFGIRVEGDKDLSEAIEDDLEETFEILETLRTAWHQTRAFGGTGTFLGADDGSSDLAKPLNEDRIRTFDFVNVMTPRELVPVDWYADPGQRAYGRVQTYRVVPIDAPPGADISSWPIVHESRIIRMSGIATTRWSSLRNPVQPGWDDSVFVRCIRIINRWADACQAAGILVQDFAPPILKLVGLARLLSSQNPAQAQQTIQTRLQGIEISKSNARAVLIDENEEYKRETVNVTGLPEMLQEAALEVASALDMPISLLMGQSPAGLNATGDADIRFFYDTVASLQKQKANPWLRRLIKLRMLAKDSPTKGKEPEQWEIIWPELWQLTEREKSTVRYQQAQTDQIYINTQVVIPEEIADSRFCGDEYSTDTHVDLEARKAIQEERIQKNAEMGAQGLNPDGTPNPAVIKQQQLAQAASDESGDSKSVKQPGKATAAPAEANGGK